ncbi:GlsB/YeaQ/YmgE family stress response membrane protein [Frankia sp. CNm7]|uniref:GlsB/YeaQ/YmgE family stress response membrane protein n=1 Tax=Frankia nepalensis TaxID=1836974 RepID=A0A937RXC0_9ACTN|nr:GlsB/YeaQ/YmgE family stress response membrane protein [Frankia nepalensis]MBL7514510.1 GlsB/YeaQ/YmgE family stress response membrane protein [Frankia nepalensis]MBL7522921.1 GlsB/YeaQ/YmgE family stress response membrane protein [Frankia nepalensis]MBL7633521.1 GlsB/YeaQ/YmgE family stress response membrane protein [Frankia nepalensis]
MFQILWIVIGGAIVGLIARALMRRGNVPLWATVCLGIVGALIGNAIAGWIGVRNTSGIDWIRHVLQIGAACVLIGVVAPFVMRRRGAGTGGGPSLFGGAGHRSRSRDRSHIDMR